jgi:putative ABC transport system permease protein
MILFDLSLALRSMRYRPVGTLIPILVVALALALSIAVIVLADAAENGLVQASDPFGMVVIGPAGSGQQLVLSTVLLQDNPIGNMPYEVYDRLHEDPRVRLAVPLALGDNVAGARLIGTDEYFFEIRRTRTASPTFTLSEGRPFTKIEHDHSADEAPDGQAVDDAHADDEHGDEHNEDGLFEAVLGSGAAKRLGLNVGDRFLATHGVGTGIPENIHEDEYTVVGILHATDTAYDAAVFTHYESIWHAHSHEQEMLSAFAASDDTAISTQITAVLVLPTGFIEQNQIVQEYLAEPTLQAAFPGAELANLINLLNQGQRLLNAIAYLVLAIAGLTLFLSMYSAIIAQQQAIAIIRSMGGSRGDVFRVVIFETLIVSLAGALVGHLLGYGLAWLIATQFGQQLGIPLPVRFLWELELVLWGLSIGVGILAGLIPAALAYRVDVVKTLFPS